MSYATFSPDGKHLAVMTFDDDANLRLALVDDGVLAEIELRDDLSDYAWMPNSRELLIAAGPLMKGSDLQIVDLDGDVVRSLRLSKRIVIDENGMAVSSDGRVAVASALSADGLAPQDLYEIDLRSGEVRQLTESPGTVESFPVFANRDQIVFSAISGDRSRAPLAVLEGETVVPLTSGDVWFDRPAVSTSGKLFASGFPVQSPFGWRAYGLSGDTAVELDVDGPIRWITVSPDGKMVAGTRPGSLGSGGSLVVAPTLD